MQLEIIMCPYQSPKEKASRILKPNIISNWHILYVKHQHEKRIHEKLIELQLNSFLPMIQTIRKWSDRKKKIYTPLFSGYVFVEIKKKNELYISTSIPGVFRFLKNGNQYSKLTNSEYNHLKLLVNAKDIENIQLLTTSPREGENRKISFGPLQGLEGQVIKSDNKHKIILRIDSMKQNILATVPLHYLMEL